MIHRFKRIFLQRKNTGASPMLINNTLDPKEKPSLQITTPTSHYYVSIRLANFWPTTLFEDIDCASHFYYCMLAVSISTLSRGGQHLVSPMRDPRLSSHLLPPPTSLAIQLNQHQHTLWKSFWLIGSSRQTGNCGIYRQ